MIANLTKKAKSRWWAIFTSHYPLIISIGFLKKLKDTAESGVEKGVDLGKKGVEKGAEVGSKAYDGTKDAAKKSVDKAKNN